MKRLIVPGIPFAVSLALSLSTAGSHLYWQDSGLFLVAVKELGVLYPPGFALYVLLCKAWTVAVWFVDFTYAVHLFSATCAALAAGTLAVAARDLLRTKGPLFHTVREEGPAADWAEVAAGCLAASGYTFWAAAILAKVYAFYFLILSLLLWRMIRADESGEPRDFTIVAVLIGLAWQAHPSAVNAGVALVLFVAFHRSIVGWKGIAWRTGLAALCALGPIHLLPLFPGAFRLGEPGFWAYATGSGFTGIPGVFGLEGSRVASVGRYFWEEFLGIGIVLVGAGAWRLWHENRRLLVGIAAWVVPVLVVTVLFKIEGQHDFWMVAAWLPIWLVAAVGLSWAGKRREFAAAAALIGLTWAVVANRKDLDQREYTLAENLGRFYFQGLPISESLATASDDVYASVLYLQRIQGQRTDVGIYPPHSWVSRQSRGRGFAYEQRPDDQVAAPDGPVYRSDPGKPERWVESVRAEELPAQFRRARGQHVQRTATEVLVRPEPYEMRLLRALLLSRKNTADTLAREGKLEEAARLYETILTLDPPMNDEPSVLFPLAIIEVGLKRYDRAEPRFKRALDVGLSGEPKARACYFLAALTGSAEWKSKALGSSELAPELRAKLEGK